MDIVRRAVGLARSAAQDAGRADEVAIAFSINGDVDTPDGRETIAPALARVRGGAPGPHPARDPVAGPQLDLRDGRGAARTPGFPVWLSFRRCRHGVCGVYGEHWGGPEGDAFGRAARRFEEMGVGALAINCIPPDHVAGMLSWLRDFTDLPLGVYPNLGYLSAAGLARGAGRQGHGVRRAGAELARRGRPDHRRLLRRAPRAPAGGPRRAGRHQARARRAPTVLDDRERRRTASAASRSSWADPRGREMFPLDVPEIDVEDGRVRCRPRAAS